MIEKKKVFWLFPVLMFALALPFTSFAESGHGKGKKWDDRPFPTKKMVEELKLSDEQVKSLKALHEKNRPASKESFGKVREARKTLMDAMEKNADEKELWKLHEAAQVVKQEAAKTHFKHMLEVRKILTPEQRAKFRETMHEQRRGRFGPPDEEE